MKRSPRFFAGLACALLAVQAVPAAAETEMTFRMDAVQKHVFARNLTMGDFSIRGGLYIDNYSGISDMRLILKSDEPIEITDGDFTRDPNRQEQDGYIPGTNTPNIVNKPCYFAEHGQAEYTQYSEETGNRNWVLWYGPGNPRPTTGVVENPDSSFLSFVIKVPKNTQTGIYKAYVSNDASDLICYNVKENLKDQVHLKAVEIVVEPDGVRGDANCDGIIDITDAQQTLTHYVRQNAKLPMTDEALEEIYGTKYILAAQEAADVTLNKVISVDDASAILQYYTMKMAKNEPKWEDIIK